MSRGGGDGGCLVCCEFFYVDLQHGAGLEAADVVVVRDEHVRLLEHLQHLHGPAVELVGDLLAQLQVGLTPEGNFAVVPFAGNAHFEKHSGVLDGDEFVVPRLSAARVVDDLRSVVRRHHASLLQLREEAHLQRLGAQLRGLARAAGHLEVHAKQEAVFDVVNHLNFRHVPLPFGRIALHPGHLLVGVERVRVAVLRHHGFAAQVRVQRIQVDRLVDLHAVGDDPRGFIVQVAHHGEDGGAHPKPDNHGDEKPHQRLRHERVDDVRARPRGVHHRPLPREPIQNVKRQRSSKDHLHDVQRRGLALVDFKLLQHIARVAANLLLQAEHLCLRDSVRHLTQTVHLVTRA
mmetsp:Transcript_20007/g.49718  ORF Transcript_20007/g.49718 Transcript_20007/m.49718 type:complete len:347 (-) Transcript_20007:1837-2877(-)